MAKHKMTDYLDYPLDIVFDDNEGLSLKDIHIETGIPIWQLRELEDLGYIGNGKVIQEGKTILKVMMYCMNNRRFIRSAVGKISYRDRVSLVKNKNNTKLIKWVKSRVFNLKAQGSRVIIKQIYDEACVHFVSLEEQGFQGFKDVQRYIKNALRVYYLDKKKH